MLLMVEKCIRGGICHVMDGHEKANNKYMKNYNKDEEESFLEYLDVNNLYGWAISQKLPVDGFKWKKHMLKFNEEFIKNYDEENHKGYILEVDAEYPKHFQLGNIAHYDLPFLLEKIKINKIEKLVVHIRSLKQALTQVLILKKVHKVIQFNQEAWLKPYIDMNAEVRKQAKNE